MWQPQGFYNQYVLRTPVILTGCEAVRGLYNYPAVKIAVIHGRSFNDQEVFKETFSKKSIRFFERSWQGEPDFFGLDATMAQLESYRPDTIIAVGGGSVIDGGKLCRLFYEFPYFDPGESRLTGDLFKTKFIAIPTTIGSGAEASSAAIFVNHEKHSKDMLVMHEMQPEVIIYDKRYVSNTPKQLLVASALDAMAHILEGYVSSIENSFLDIMAEKALYLLHMELEKIMNNEMEIDYERLQYAGYLGGLVQNHCTVGAAHGIAHQLTDYGYSHGEAVGLLLPVVISSNAKSDAIAARYEKISHVAGFYDCSKLLELIERVIVAADIDTGRAKLKKLLGGLVSQHEFCEQVRNDRGGKGNPVPMTDEYLGKIAERF